MANMENEFQQAIFSAISAALPAVECASYMAPNQALPFIKLGRGSASDYPIGHEVQHEVHTWSRAEGPHEVQAFMQAIRDALHATASTTVSTWRFVCIRETFSQVLEDEEDEVFHGIQTFRAIAERA